MQHLTTQHLTTQHLIRHGFPAALVMFGLAACADVPTSTKSSVPTVPVASVSAAESDHGKHIVTFSGSHAPADFAARVTARGGAVDEILDGPGLAIVSGLTAAAAADLSATEGINAVATDKTILADPSDDETFARNPSAASNLTSGDESVDGLEDDSDEGSPRRDGLPDRATYYAYQWNMRAIKARAAWEAGHLGSPDVTVYLLDTGIDYEKADLEGRVDKSRSISLVPSASKPDEYAQAKAEHVEPFMDFHSHGTAVASTIVSNGVDFAGVSTQTTLVAVKVLNRTRVGLVSTFLRGITYAADSSADIIHLSLSFPGFPRAGNEQTIAQVDAATTYAHNQGAVIVVAAGNAASDLDGDWWRFCNAKYVICVSATGPTRAVSPTRQLHVDEPAAYTNFGVNTITVAGPGGTDAPNLRVRVNCSGHSLITTGNPAPCGAHAPWFETVGTTYSAAAVSGLAALIVSRVGHSRVGPERADRIRKVLTESADDLGPRGPDKFYGEGRINVARAMAMRFQRGIQ